MQSTSLDMLNGFHFEQFIAPEIIAINYNILIIIINYYFNILILNGLILLNFLTGIMK